jgi:hypothetical protein
MDTCEVEGCAARPWKDVLHARGKDVLHAQSTLVESAVPHASRTGVNDAEPVVQTTPVGTPPAAPETAEAYARTATLQYAYLTSTCSVWSTINWRKVGDVRHNIHV